ncbi:C40 family peptidase [Amycolatopsis sp. OK19-0408]|uniref:C40 family peptidase n=1 Tax=Amycolatopsis iheyensis TaxID=2945988 RepID=A0A9X2NI74_9PSEU|nr:C40 family peptidase [Amycolatopsis iheyensis]MCR6488308.1 C40 family peptidase [Amycolatopsis iheyensis]
MGSKIGAGIAAAVLAIPLLIGAQATGIVGQLFSSGSSAGSLTCTPDGAPTGSVPGMTAEQMGNAAVIVAIGKQRGVPEPGWMVAIAAALQESGLRNLSYGDRDSLGLFQQRPSMGWGSPAQLTTPAYAATTFFEHLQATPGWQQMSVTDAAQAVQRSGFPHAYAKHEDAARAIVAAVSGVRCEPAPAVTGPGNCDTIQVASPAAMAAINYACGQRKLPYLWGGTSPDTGFDCSGLTQAAYAAAGIALPRTSREQYAAGPHVPAGQPLAPGDLVFYATAGHVHHVGLYIGGGNMIDAPDVGQTIGIRPYHHPGDDYYGATRPSQRVVVDGGAN